MLLLVGVLLIMLGLISGAALLIDAVGLMTITHAVTLWVMFPFGSVFGLLLAALGARTRAVPGLLKVTGSTMLVLAIAAVGALVLSSTSLMSAPRGAAALWYVFGVGVVVGVANFLAPAPPGEPA